MKLKNSEALLPLPNSSGIYVADHHLSFFRRVKSFKIAYTLRNRRNTRFRSSDPSSLVISSSAKQRAFNFWKLFITLFLPTHRDCSPQSTSRLRVGLADYKQATSASRSWATGISYRLKSKIGNSLQFRQQINPFIMTTGTLTPESGKKSILPLR